MTKEMMRIGFLHCVPLTRARERRKGEIRGGFPGTVGAKHTSAMATNVATRERERRPERENDVLYKHFLLLSQI